jgi:3-(3-hydroxy-phenyl)propionate hydroxylase
VQTQSIRNKQNLEAREDKERDRFRDELRRIAADPALRRDYLLRVSMIASLTRAAELG